jgi:hypothetical protein
MAIMSARPATSKRRGGKSAPVPTAAAKGKPPVQAIPKPAHEVTAAEILAMASKPAQAVAVVAKAQPAQTGQAVTAAPDKPLAPAADTVLFRKQGGTDSTVFNETVFRKLLGAIETLRDDPTKEQSHRDFIAAEEKRIFAAAAVALAAFKPTDAIEAMIASQAVGLHFAAMACLSRAANKPPSYDTMSRLHRDAANLMRAMTDMLEALDRKRGKAPQVVRVERVIVQDGGQAVVGNVNPAVPGTGAR